MADLQRGLEWEPSLFGLSTPLWTVEPDINTCVIEFLAEGTLNKVYTIICDGLPLYVLRVSLPVHPHFKTMSEEATIEYVRYHTDIPAPQVLCHEAANNDQLGFEWMIMNRVSGVALGDQWRRMNWLKKEMIVRNIIVYLVQLFRARFPAIGNLVNTADMQQFPTKDIPNEKLLGMEYSTEESGFCLSEIVSVPFFIDDHLKVDVPRGPFRHSRDWLEACLQLHIHDAYNKSYDDEDDGDDEDDEDDEDEDEEPDEEPDEFQRLTSPEAMKSRAQRLIDLLPQFFPRDETEEFVLHHHDLNSHNILVDNSHDLAAVIDWECINTCPLWLACEIPKFLDGTVRDTPPNPDDWPIKDWGDGNEDRNGVYYEQLEEYEKTQLRRFFLEEMERVCLERVCPDWVRVHNERNRKAYFEEVVAHVGTQIMAKAIDEWLGAVGKGEEPSSVSDY